MQRKFLELSFQHFQSLLSATQAGGSRLGFIWAYLGWQSPPQPPAPPQISLSSPLLRYQQWHSPPVLCYRACYTASGLIWKNVFFLTWPSPTFLIRFTRRCASPYFLSVRALPFQNSSLLALLLFCLSGLFNQKLHTVIWYLKLIFMRWEWIVPYYAQQHKPPVRLRIPSTPCCMRLTAIR